MNSGRWSCCRLAWLACASLLLSGCGFQLRGNTTAVADTAGALYVDAAREVSIGKPLIDALRARDFDMVDRRDAADVMLRLRDEQISERIVSIQKSGRVSEIELSHSVSLLIGRVGDDPAAPDAPDRDALANRVDVTREYTYDDRGVLGKQEEADILRSEMSDELVRQVLLRTIASLSSVGSVAELPVDDTDR